MPNSFFHKLLTPFARKRHRPDAFMVAAAAYSFMFGASIFHSSMREAAIPLPTTSPAGLPALIIFAYVVTLIAIAARRFRFKRTPDGNYEAEFKLHNDPVGWLDDSLIIDVSYEQLDKADSKPSGESGSS